MGKKRDVVGQNGFPNMSAIRERLIRDSDFSAVDFWQADFSEDAKVILQRVKRTGSCTENDANDLCEECSIVAARRRGQDAAKQAEKQVDAEIDDFVAKAKEETIKKKTHKPRPKNEW